MRKDAFIGLLFLQKHNEMLNMTNLSEITVFIKILQKKTPKLLFLPRKAHCNSKGRAVIEHLPSWAGEMAPRVGAAPQRVWVQFPAPTTTSNSSSRGPDSYLPWAPSTRAHTGRQTTHTYKKIILKKSPSGAGERAHSVQLHLQGI